MHVCLHICVWLCLYIHYSSGTGQPKCVGLQPPAWYHFTVRDSKPLSQWDRTAYRALPWCLGQLREPQEQWQNLLKPEALDCGETRRCPTYVTSSIWICGMGRRLHFFQGISFLQPEPPKDVLLSHTVLKESQQEVAFLCMELHPQVKCSSGASEVRTGKATYSQVYENRAHQPTSPEEARPTCLVQHPGLQT